jgi:hypothetical protein
LRIIKTLPYPSLRNTKFIKKIKAVLIEIRILPEKYVQKDLFIKDS